jgi:hypothetical protein
MLDRFFFLDTLLKGVDRFRSRIAPSKCFDHNPFFLKLKFDNPKLGIPFKFNTY